MPHTGSRISRRSVLALGLAGLAAACGPGKSKYEPAPLPADLVIAAPAAEVPANMAAFLGIWNGTWGRDRNGKLAVTSVAADGTANVIHSSGTSAGTYRAGFVETTARISGNVLTLPQFSNGAVVTYTINEDGSMTGESSRDGIATRGRFTRQ